MNQNSYYLIFIFLGTQKGFRYLTLDLSLLFSFGNWITGGCIRFAVGTCLTNCALCNLCWKFRKIGRSTVSSEISWLYWNVSLLYSNRFQHHFLNLCETQLIILLQVFLQLPVLTRSSSGGRAVLAVALWQGPETRDHSSAKQVKQTTGN